jgi:hypothetical protein
MKKRTLTDGNFDYFFMGLNITFNYAIASNSMRGLCQIYILSVKCGV